MLICNFLRSNKINEHRTEVDQLLCDKFTHNLCRKFIIWTWYVTITSFQSHKFSVGEFSSADNSNESLRMDEMGLLFTLHTHFALCNLDIEDIEERGVRRNFYLFLILNDQNQMKKDWWEDIFDFKLIKIK